MRYMVHYLAGPYEGNIDVYADDEDAAISGARAKIRRQMSLPMYSDVYRVVGAHLEDEERAAS